MKISTFFILLSFIVIATGCPKTVPDRPETVNRAVDYQIRKLAADVERYECLATGEYYTEPTDAENVKKGKYVSCGTNAVNITQARVKRDETVNRLIRAIDSEYFRFESELATRRSSGSFLADFTDIGLGLATTITNGERAKTVLGAVLTSFRGWRKSASLNFYREQTVELLITKMQTSRTKVMSQILKQKIEDTSSERVNYTLDDALNDVLGYFYAGTLYRAFQELQEDTSIKAQEAKREFRQLQVKSSKPVTQKSLDDANNADQILDSYEKLLAEDEEEKTAAVKEKLADIYKQMQSNEVILAKIKDTKLMPDKNTGEELIEGIREVRAEFDESREDLIDKINKIIIKAGKPKF